MSAIRNTKLFRELIGKARRAAAYAIQENPDKPRYGEYAYGVIAKTLAKSGDLEKAFELVMRYNDGFRACEHLKDIAVICAENGNLQGVLKTADAISVNSNPDSHERCEALSLAAQVFAADRRLQEAERLISLIPDTDVTSFIRTERIIACAAIAKQTGNDREIRGLALKAEKLPFWSERSRAYAAIAEALLI